MSYASVEETKLKGSFILQPVRYKDSRGYFQENFNLQAFQKATRVSTTFVQDNLSKSKINVLRGLHFQIGDYAQAKLVSVIHGKVLDVIVDLRLDSPTYKQHISIELCSDKGNQLWIPRGFAHGFLALTNEVILQYKCDNYYNFKAERGLKFNDPALQIDWGIPSSDVQLSDRDKNLPLLKEFNLKHKHQW